MAWCDLLIDITASTTSIQRISQLSASLTHVLSGPLLIILSFAQMLLAFGTSMSSWITHEARVCSDEAFDINVCRAQGFFIVAGIHLGITTYAARRDL